MISEMENILGNFKVNSGKVIITDPCYKVYDDSVILDVVKGTWTAYVDYNNDGRVANLVVVNERYDHSKRLYEYNFEYITDDLGVDSGQMGVFDYDFYPSDPRSEENEEVFYGKICYITSNEDGGGVIESFGAVSSTGYGDGAYSLYGAKHTDGNYYAFYIEFISDDEDEDDEDEDNEDEDNEDDWF